MSVSGETEDRSACRVAKELTAEDVVGQFMSIWWWVHPPYNIAYADRAGISMVELAAGLAWTTNNKLAEMAVLLITDHCRTLQPLISVQAHHGFVHSSTWQQHPGCITLTMLLRMALLLLLQAS